MQFRTGYVIESVAYQGWLNKMADGITTNLFGAIRFSTKEEAESWMQGIYAPKDKENYEIKETLTTIEVKESEPIEPMAEDS